MGCSVTYVLGSYECQIHTTTCLNSAVSKYREYRLSLRFNQQLSYHGKSKPCVSGFWWVDNAELFLASCTKVCLLILIPLCIVIVSWSILVHCKVLEPVRTRRVGLVSVAWCEKLPWNNSDVTCNDLRSSERACKESKENLYPLISRALESTLNYFTSWVSRFRRYNYVPY